MKFLKDMYLSTLKGNTIEKVLGIVWWLITISLACFLFYVYYNIIDYTNTDIKTTDAIVTSKKYNAPYYSTTFLYVGKVMIPQQHYYSEEYILNVVFGNKNSNVNVNKELYDIISEKDVVKIQYKLGRFSKSIKILNVKLK